MGKHTEQIKMLKASKGIRGTNYTRINQYVVAGIDETGEDKLFRTAGNVEYIHEYMNELREKGFTSVAIICEY